jgi:hypothetical protein
LKARTLKRQRDRNVAETARRMFPPYREFHEVSGETYCAKISMHLRDSLAMLATTKSLAAHIRNHLKA